MSSFHKTSLLYPRFARKLRDGAITFLAMAMAFWVGMQVNRWAPGTFLQGLLAVGALVATCISSRMWLVLTIGLTTVRDYDNVFAGGFLSWSKLLTVVILVIYAARVATHQVKLRVFHDWLLPLILILGWGMASLLWAFDLALATWTVVSWASLIILQGLIYALFEEDFGAVKLGLYTLVGAMTAIALIGMYVILVDPDWSLGVPLVSSVPYPAPAGLRIGRFFGFYTDANSVAMMLGYAIFVAVAILNAGGSSGTSKPVRVALQVAILVLLFALLNTLSRSGWAAFLIGMAYLLHRTKHRGHMMLLLAMMGGLVYLYQIVISARLARLPETGWAPRLPILKLGLTEFAAAPITGIGLYSFKPRLMAARVAIFGRYPAIHNTYLKFLVELGLPGFCLLAWFCVALLRRYRRNSSLTQGEPTSLLYWINRGFGACFLGTGVFALFQGISTFNPFWIVLGLFAATSSAIERAYGDIRDE